MVGSPRRHERCAIYTRQSVARRGGDPAVSSCNIQYARCHELALRRGWVPLDERFDDEGESGESLDRPAFERLLGRIEEKAVDRVLVWRLDRLSRSIGDWTAFDGMLRARGIGFTVGDGSIDRTGSALGVLQMNALAIFAEFERDIIAERIREARAVRSARGERTAGKIPFGYRSERRTKQLVVHPQEAAVVKWMFDEAAAGVLPAAIAAAVRARSSERVWTPRLIVRLLQSPVYAGLLPDGRRGVQPAIVAPALHARVAATLASRRTREPAERQQASKPDPFLLRGVLVCATCDRPMTTSTSTRPRPRRTPKQRYYRCRRLGCDGGQVSAPYVEGRFFGLLIGESNSHLGVRTRKVLHALGDIWHNLTPINQQRAVRMKFERIVLRANRTLGGVRDANLAAFHRGDPVECDLADARVEALVRWRWRCAGGSR